MNPTIVLVHGAFAESASWDGVIEPIRGSGHRVITVTGASHALAVSQPQATVDLILEAAALRAAA